MRLGAKKLSKLFDLIDSPLVKNKLAFLALKKRTHSMHGFQLHKRVSSENVTQLRVTRRRVGRPITSHSPRILPHKSPSAATVRGIRCYCRNGTHRGIQITTGHPRVPHHHRTTTILLRLRCNRFNEPTFASEPSQSAVLEYEHQQSVVGEGGRFVYLETCPHV